MLVFSYSDRMLRAKVLSEIAQSDRLRAEYRRRRRGGWRRALFQSAVRFALPLGLLLMPLSMSMGVIAGGLELVRQGAGIGDTAAAMLGLHAVQLCGILMMTLGLSDRAYFSGATDETGGWLPLVDLRALSHLPVSDTDLANANTVQTILWLLPLAVFCGTPFALLAWEFQGIAHITPASAGLAIMHGLAFASAAIIAATYAPVHRGTRQWLCWMGLVILVGAIFVGFGLPRLGAFDATLLRLALYATPPGWVGAALLDGFVLKNPLGWLWLCPAGLTISIAAWVIYEQARSGFAIREFIVSPVDGKWYGVIERGFRVPAEVPPPPPLFGAARHQWSVERRTRIEASPNGGPVFEPESIGLQCHLLGESTPGSWQLVDRLCASVLSNREQLLLRAWSSGRHFTVQWLAALAALLASYVFVAWVSRPGKESEYVLAWMLAAACVTFVPLTVSNAERATALNGVARILILYPVGFKELSIASLKREAVHYSSLAPLAAMYGAAVSSWVGVSLLEGIILGMMPVGVCFVIQPVVDCLKLSAATNDTKRISMWLLWLGGGGALVICSSTAMLWPRLDVRIGALSAAALISGGIWLLYRRAFHRGDFDLLLKPIVMRSR